MTIFFNIAVSRARRVNGGRNRREGADRRGRPTPPISRYWLFGRRQSGRRDGETANIYVDRYTRTEVLLVTGILALSLLDMAFTLLHLKAGGSEANPIMAWALEWGGHGAFKAVKLASTFLGLFVLLIHIRFRRVKALLTCAFVIYAAILLFHLYLTYVRVTTGTL